MNRFLATLVVALIALCQFSAAVYAGSLDEYYLQQFGEATNAQLQKALLSAAPELPEARCGMPLKRGLRRDWNLLEESTRKVLAKQLAAPVLTNEAIYVSGSGHFRIHYATSGPDTPDIAAINRYTGLRLTSALDWARKVADTFDYVYSTYSSLGYRPAPTTTGAPYDVYLLSLAAQKFYGTTNSDQPVASGSYPYAFSSWMELDSSFTDSIYSPNTFSPLKSLQITAAHEYHHAIQYGYNYYFDIWYAEATSTWMEDELYDSVNQLYNYVPSYLNQTNQSIDAPIDGSSEYGRWIFNRYLAEKRTATSIRNFWEALAQTDPSCTVSNNVRTCSDIAMLPIIENVLSNTYGTPLSQDFFGFAKRIYLRDWTTHQSEIARIHDYVPLASYSVYPVNSSSTPTPSVTLPHYAFAYYKFIPASGTNSLTISINKTSGIQTALFKKVSGNASEILPTSSSSASASSYAVSGFGSATEVVLLVANTSGTDGQSANFSTDGSLVPLPQPTPTPTPAPSSGSGSGSGCFIATAAYGSYLHPQVQQLRHFRDTHLLTNAPGRAFVALYYRFSPPLSDFIARHAALRGVTRLALTPVIVAVVHPLIPAVSLVLLTGTVLMARLRRRKACAPAGMSITRTTSSL